MPLSIDTNSYLYTTYPLYEKGMDEILKSDEDYDEILNSDEESNEYASEKIFGEISSKNNSSNAIIVEAKKQTLGGLLKRVEMMQSNLYTGRSWSRLMKTYGNSQAVFLKESAEERDVDRALRSLTRDLMALRQAENDEDPHREKLPVVLKEDNSFEQTVTAATAIGDMGIDISV
ncbi:MAG: hypothetical protein FWE14_01555 [Lachnospiraceae bacterium]|nr:hypothetical protein [Lachnospiraceae bacterium]